MLLSLASDAGTVLDAWFPAPSLTQTPDLSIADELEELAAEHPARNARTEVRTASINLDEAPEDALDAYLRLHLLSHTLVRPNELNLDGLFGTLANVAWTNHGPVLACRVPEARNWSAQAGPPEREPH